VLGRVGEHDYVGITRFTKAEVLPAMLVLRPDEPLFFGNAEPLFLQARERVLRQPAVKLVVFSLEESADLDSTALESLGEFCSWLNGRGGELRLARLKDSARDALLRANLPQLSGEALDYSSVDDAVRGQCVTPE
jgi:MFS superfamily sulfate permease-like transporter